MRIYRNHIKTGNAAYQRQFADSLRETMGLDCAIKTCRDQSWQGILRALMHSKHDTKQN